jgi:hypothetical protein
MDTIEQRFEQAWAAALPKWEAELRVNPFAVQLIPAAVLDDDGELTTYFVGAPELMQHVGLEMSEGQAVAIVVLPDGALVAQTRECALDVKSDPSERGN